MMAFWEGWVPGAGFSTMVFTARRRGFLGVGSAVEAAVGGDGVAFDDLGAEDAGLGLVEGFDHLLHAGGGGVDDVVGGGGRRRVRCRRFPWP